MKKITDKSNNFQTYANHLNSQNDNFNKNLLQEHNIEVEGMDDLYNDFYKEYPEFCVDDCNRLMKLLNDDYTNYLKWMTHE